MLVSSVSGAVSSYTVYNLLIKDETTSGSETTIEAESTTVAEQANAENTVIFPEETTIFESTTEENTFVPAYETTAAFSDSVKETTTQAKTESTTEQQTVATQTGKTKGEIYAEAVNSIVCITASGYQTYSSFFGQTYQQPVTSSGSGFIITSDGYIVTNYHVVEGAKELSVSTYDGTEYTAKLIGYESANDVAVIKISGSFTPVTLGNSDTLQVGDDIMVIGNALGELSYTFTDGIVSYLSRSVTTDAGTSINMFQTNAAINEGNSGGPVYNMDGKVIGIASAKYASSSIEGLGFCIPFNDVKTIVNDLITLGYVSGKPLLGISVQTISYSMSIKYGYPTGCYIVALDENSCTALAGLEAADVITYVDGERVSGADSLSSALSGKKAGDSITVTYSRNSQTYTASITLDEYKPTQARTSYTNVYDF